MRARIRQHTCDEEVWILEVKYWWSTWIYRHTFFSKSTALRAAKTCLDPVIIEATK